jgi:hypothetical protein
MTDASNSMFSAEQLPVPIYDAMLGRALKLLEAGSTLEAAEVLTTPAETMLLFQHPEATRVADWAWKLLEDERHTGEVDRS